MSSLIIFEKIIVSLPIMIIIFSILIIMFFISINRNHTVVFYVSLLSFIFALISLFIIFKYLILPFNFINIILIDNYTIFNLIIILLTGFFSCLFSYFWLEKININKEELYLLLLLSTLGAILLLVSNNIILFYISTELLFFPLFGLIGFFINYNRSLESALKYMILSSITSIFLLLGITLIYLILGSFDIPIWINSFDFISIQDRHVLIIGLFIIFFSFAFKLAIYPFYFWISDVYKGIEYPILIFFSVVTKISIFSFLIKFFENIPIYYIKNIYVIIYIMTFLSILIGNIIAFMQNSIKSLLAYTSISYFGYIFIILISCSNKLLIFEMNILFLFNYFLISIGILGALSIISNIFYINKNYDNISIYNGLFWKSPYLSICLTISLLSAIGIPLTLGFISKFYLIFVLFNEKYFFLILCMLIGNLIGIYCYLKIIITLYLKPSNLLFRKNLSKINIVFQFFILFLINFLIIILGIYPKLLMFIIDK